MTLARLLKVRADKKRKKPTFIREESKKIKKLSKMGWRKPRGWHNKMRHGFKGHRRCVRMGWGSPRAVKGLHRTGLEMIAISAINQIEKINPSTQGIIIGAGVGTKKKMEIITLALKDKITIINIRDPVKFLEGKTAEFKKKKEDQLAKREEKKKKAKEAAPKKSIEQKVEKAETEEEKKTREKKELDKKLITEQM
jgi:large subunit ribosomal protein L32e